MKISNSIHPALNFAYKSHLNHYQIIIIILNRQVRQEILDDLHLDQVWNQE